MVLRELRVAYEPLRLEHCHDLRLDVSNPSLVIDLARTILQNEPSEVLGVFCLTTKMRVICYYEVSRGSLSQCSAHPREIFRAAILANAASIVVAHNHPSGDSTPSPDDRTLTARLVAAGDLLCIPVLDHVVIGDRNHFRFHQAGLIAAGPR